jgi:prepilin-type N-terminal cleavage/methylation domain-containing protein
VTRTRGFTLIELLAASALAAVLILVMFQVVGSLGRAKAALARSEAGGAAAQSPWKSDLLDAVRWDLANADTAKFEADRIVLTSHGSLDRRTLAPSHQPVTVTYSIERRGRSDGGYLVRRQVPRGGATNDRGWSEVVCAGVSRFGLEPLQSAGLLGLRGDPLAGPLRVRVEGPGGVLIDEIIVVK